MTPSLSGGPARRPRRPRCPRRPSRWPPLRPLSSLVRLAGAGAVAAVLLLAAAPPASAQDGIPGGMTGVLRDRGLVVRFVPGEERRARAWLDFLAGQPPLPALPDSVPSGVEVFLVPDPAAMDALLGGRVPEWSAGVAVPARDLLAIPAWQGSLTAPGEAARVLRHEWAHLGLHGWLEGLRIPRWFSEGYAEWASGWTAREAWRLRVLLATGRAPPLDSLTLGWPRDRGEAGAAYLISATLLEYLVQASGERGLEILLGRWRETGSFEASLRRTYGVTSGQLEEDWREWVKGRYGWLYVLSHSSLVWGVLALLLLLMTRARRNRNRERMARLRAGEPAEEPAWWAETPPDVSPGPRPPPGDGRGDGPEDRP